jgi:UDP-2-acetamido-3-amino-2,3-dideoxy-glucuronate N-acetyltransferase
MSSIDPAARVHPTADLEPDVDIGAGTAIWHRAQVRTGARIGADSIIGRDAFIDTDVAIGSRVKIQNGALVYHGVTVGDGVFIGPGAILTNDRYPRATNADGELAQAGEWTLTATTLHDGCSIGAGAIVIAGCDIGPYATVGAGAVVTHPVPAHALVAGNPARTIGWVCVCGQRLRTADGIPAPADHERYATDRVLDCAACGRLFDIDADRVVLAS